MSSASARYTNVKIVHHFFLTLRRIFSLFFCFDATKMSSCSSFVIDGKKIIYVSGRHLISSPRKRSDIYIFKN